MAPVWWRAGLLYLLALLPLRRCSAQNIQLKCDTQEELVQHLAFVRDTCEQVHETFANKYNPVPLTCEHADCARAVARVSQDCDGLLQVDWFETARTKLQAAVAKCALVPQSPADVYPVRDKDHAKPITACGGTLSDGKGKYGSNWDKVAILDAGPGQKARVTVETQGLAKADWVGIYDGDRVNLDARTNEPTNELKKLRGNKLPHPRVFTASGRFMYVRMITNNHQVSTGFTMAISCVCEDATSWKDSIGRSCAHFARGGKKSLYATCEASANHLAAQGRTATGLVLPAKEACPKACGACEVDPCSQWPCHNGGVCLKPEPRKCDTVGQLSDMNADVTAACCNEPSESCKGGAPSSCNADCARILVPMHRACSKGILKEQEFAATKTIIDRAVAKCGGHGGGHRRRVQKLLKKPTCSCVGGYTGDHCDVADPCDGIKCGVHGSCTRSKCECTNGWTGASCEFGPCHAIQCANQGTCNHGVCKCKGGYTGKTCLIKPPKNKPCCSKCPKCCRGGASCTTDRNAGTCSGTYSFCTGAACEKAC